MPATLQTCAKPRGSQPGSALLGRLTAPLGTRLERPIVATALGRPVVVAPALGRTVVATALEWLIMPALGPQILTAAPRAGATAFAPLVIGVVSVAVTMRACRASIPVVSAAVGVELLRPLEARVGGAAFLPCPRGLLIGLGLLALGSRRALVGLGLGAVRTRGPNLGLFAMLARLDPSFFLAPLRRLPTEDHRSSDDHEDQHDQGDQETRFHITSSSFVASGDPYP
ncbi:MAG: hypothetical protein ACR2LH_03935 [Thermoleophilaceae bacterium]